MFAIIAGAVLKVDRLACPFLACFILLLDGLWGTAAADLMCVVIAVCV
jgi:hypothetical protein